MEQNSKRHPYRWETGLLLLPLGLAFWLCRRIIDSIHGLPLDDAYIYWRYIENLRQGQGLSFNPGEVSFGVTSFLYTAVCFVAGKFLPWMDTMSIMQWVGVFFFLVLIYFAERLIWEYTGNLWIALLAGFLLSACRPLVFTAPAGLETLQFSAIVVVLFYIMLLKPQVSSVWLGVGAALLFLTRPEGLLVAAGYTFFYLHGTILFRDVPRRSTWRATAQYVFFFWLGFAIASLPYLLFVKYHSGFWLPTTFYGKLYNLNPFILFPWHEKVRLGFEAIQDSYKEIVLNDPTPFLFYLLFLFTALSGLIFSYRCGTQTLTHREYAVRAVMLSLFLYPFLYGYKFHVSPLFGGYFIRYIQLLLVLLAIEFSFALGFTLSFLSNWLKSNFARSISVSIASFLLGLFVLYNIAPSYRYRFPFDLDLYHTHASINEGVRKQAAYWIRDNTSPQSGVMVGTTGLGVVGGYAGRYCKDEAGLINPDIHPYLFDALSKYPETEIMVRKHFLNILEYMKINRLSYYTAYTPLLHDIRFIRSAAEITDPNMAARDDVKDLSKIWIYRFDPQEKYDLWEEYDKYAEFKDVGVNPVEQNRIKLTFWDEIPVIAVDVREPTAEISADYIFPDLAEFTAGLSLDYPPRTYSEDEWVQFILFAEIDGKRTRVYSEEIPINQFTPRKTLKTIRVPLLEYSNRYGKLILGVNTSPKKEVGILWAGWVKPMLINKKRLDETTVANEKQKVDG